MKSDRYYEAHVTIDPVDGEQLRRFHVLASHYNFRVAELLMVKGDRTVPSDRDAFCTARSTDLDEIKELTAGLVGRLENEGFGVRRFKIEDTLLDSKLGDRLPGVHWKLSGKS